MPKNYSFAALSGLACCALIAITYFKYIDQRSSISNTISRQATNNQAPEQALLMDLPAAEAESSNAIPGQFTSTRAVERALQLQLPKVDTVVRPETEEIAEMAMKKVEELDYDGALALTVDGLEKYPTDFTLQSDLAALLGDHSNNFLSPMKDVMEQRAKEIFDDLIIQSENQPRQVFYPFKNEYFYRFAKYKEQYELGLQRVNEYWGTDEWMALGAKGYYCQGVGASNYARELLKQGNKKLALDYVQKAIVAWAQCFSYKNDYYNSYVHYALALGILGYKVEMMRALEHSAAIIGRDLSYLEFQEVIQFISEAEEKHWL